MTRYVQVQAQHIPIGRTALLLFVHDGQLCAGVVEHLRDGRFDRRVPDRPSHDDIVLVICRLMADHPAPPLYVVLEPQAYWPDPFPALMDSARSRDVSMKSHLV